MFAFSVSFFVIRYGISILAELSAWSRLAILPDHGHFTGLLLAVDTSFVFRQGSGIYPNRPAWLLLAIFSVHYHFTGFLSGVVSTFVRRQSMSILADN